MSIVELSGIPAASAGRRRFARRPPALDIAVYLVLGIVLLAVVVGPFITPASAFQADASQVLRPPSAAHWFGTDALGRDVMWRVIDGAHVSVLAALAIVAISAVAGTVIAVGAALGGRRIDMLLTAVCDIGFSVPGLVVALGFAATIGPSLGTAILATVVLSWTLTARLLRGILREIREMPFVDGATALGVSRAAVLFRHVLPNALDVLWVKWSADIGKMIVLLAGLSFIGVGAQPPSAEWGAMIADAQGYITTAWWTVLAPGLAIVATASAFGLLGEILQTRIDPALHD